MAGGSHGEKQENRDAEHTRRNNSRLDDFNCNIPFVESVFRGFVIDFLLYILDK